jgi:hypothetical protein
MKLKQHNFFWQSKRENFIFVQSYSHYRLGKKLKFQMLLSAKTLQFFF